MPVIKGFLETFWLAEASASIIWPLLCSGPVDP
jgi:hypothetical protein